MSRHKRFDSDLALQKALRLFWQCGYANTSLQALVETMGISRSCLLAVFGSKQDLFEQVLDVYMRQHASFFVSALVADRAETVLATLLLQAVQRQTQEEWPPGCLLLHAMQDTPPWESTIGIGLRERYTIIENNLAKRFAQADAEQELAPEVSAEQLASWAMSNCHGLAAQARQGVSRETLQRNAELMLRMPVWR